MPEFVYAPPLPTKGSNDGFVQVLSMLDAGKTVGVARWHVRPGASDGVVQLLDFTITGRARQGLGGLLMDELQKQVRAYCKIRGARLRRMWMAVEQKGQIIGRAFLTEHGFHHVGTMQELMKGQDTLLYMKSFD